MIAIRDLRVDYDDVCAVDDLNLEIGPGEVFGLIGPNGAGKTSTIRVLAGLLEPTYGEVEIASADVRDAPEEAQRKVGFMPDFPPLYEDLKVWEFLDLFAASYFVPRRERPATIDRYLELVGLTEKRQAMVAELSRGMRQRLMLAKTLLPEPQVLLLDEPASGMDPNGRAEFKEVLRALGAEGRTVLVSSHILSEMDQFCTSIGVMVRGRLLVSGPVETVGAEIGGGQVLAVEVLAGHEEFRQVVACIDDAGEPVLSGDVFELPFDGDSRAASELLARLCAQGVRVASFARKRRSLEDVFLQIGAKELS